MNDDDMPISTTESLKKEDSRKQENKGDSYFQKGNRGIDYMNNSEIKDKAKVAGKIEENNNNQFTVNINTQQQSKDNPIGKQNTIRMFIKEGNKEASIEAPYSKDNLKNILIFLKQRFNDDSLEVENIEKGSIKLTLKGSEEGLKRIEKSL